MRKILKNYSKLQIVYMQKEKSKILPSFDDKKDLANKFANFFSQKINNIRDELSIASSKTETDIADECLSKFEAILQHI